MFVLRMAVRETRASWRRLLFFFVCISVGVAAIVTLRSLIQSVRVVFADEARALIAGDVLISTTRDWTPTALEIIDRRLSEAAATGRTETVETPTMVRPAAPGQALTRMVELRAVAPEFPLYGTVGLDGGQRYSFELLRDRGVLVRPELLTALDVGISDRIVIGNAEFTIRGVITNEPGRRVGQFSMGPRVLMSLDDLRATGLIGFGSRVRRVMLVKVPEAEVEDLVSTLRDDLADQFVTARSFRASEDEIGRDFERAEDYLSLVGLVIVILGGIAVASVTRVFVLQKIRSIAVLKCLGATSRRIITVYLVQVMTLGLAGSLLGVALARIALTAVPLLAPADSASLLAEVEYGVSPDAAAQGTGIGVLVSLLFSIVPLLEVRFVKPSWLLRDEPRSGGRDYTRIAAMVLVSGALVALTAWQAASLEVGIWVSAGFLAVAIVLQSAGRLLVRMIAPLERSRSFPLRHAVLHLSRPGNQTRVVLLAVGLGAFFIIGVRSLQASLLEEFSVEVREGSPDMFLMDIQPDQEQGIRDLLENSVQGAGAFTLIPVLRARVVGVNGRETTLESFEDVRERGSLAREYTITFRSHLERNEKILDGELWDGPADSPEVSVEREAAARFNLFVGDVMRFDVLGREIGARVGSIRSVDWRDSRSGGFIFVFRPGPLDDAPHTFIAPLKGPEHASARAQFQHALVRRFPNVTVIDFQEILAMVRDILSRVTLAIGIVGGLVLFSGMMILIGAVAMTKFQRVYEAAVFKTLGASSRVIARMLVLEYGVLGLLAGVIGSAAGGVLSWSISRFALEIPWRIFPMEHLGGVVATAVLVAAVGVLSSLDVLRHKPLATLNSE